MEKITRLLCITFFLISLATGCAGAADTSEKTADEHYLMGNAFYSFGLAENATHEYRLAVAKNPDLSEAWNNLGLSLTAQEKYDEALQALANATRLSPNDAEAWYNLGYTYGMLGNTTAELAAYDKALSITPNMTIAWRNIGAVRFEQGNYTGAVHAFEQATSFDPESGIGWYYLGTAYEKSGDLSAAASVLKKAIEKDQNLTMAQDRLQAIERNLTGTAQVNQVPGGSEEKSSSDPFRSLLETIGINLLISL